jgi:hypothetical protein
MPPIFLPLFKLRDHLMVPSLKLTRFLLRQFERELKLAAR